ncbi:hypothetical protein RND81_09G090700 [Saponaria officinalis]|uniref:CCHC-type domain-containing protein n=1 Tax=Saponaria officinalis TaxID=3572 RepID=A0AAW1IKQ2_SAPOF
MVNNRNNNNNGNNNYMRYILEKEKLNGTNFLDWYRNLRIVLTIEKKEHVLETPLPDEPTEDATVAAINAYNRQKEISKEVACVMLASMTPELKKQFEFTEAYAMVQELKTRAILDAKLEKNKPVGPHVLRLIGLFKRMGRLGVEYSREMATDIILHSLHNGFAQFILNYNMNGMEKSLTELHGMLKTAEKKIKTNSRDDVLMVSKGKGFKRSSKGKEKAKVQPTKGPQKPAGPKGGGKAKATDANTCLYCRDSGHWKRDCPEYQEDLKNGNVASTSGMYMIEIHFADSASWVLDTGCSSHICTNVQGLKRSRKLIKGDVDLRVGNGARVAALALLAKTLFLFLY